MTQTINTEDAKRLVTICRDVVELTRQEAEAKRELQKIQEELADARNVLGFWTSDETKAAMAAINSE